jgi:putative spermidine/putrescine transport system substrate-binding protein
VKSTRNKEVTGKLRRLATTLTTFGTAMTIGLAATHDAVAADAITINVVDVAGNLALTQEALEAYRTKNPQLVSKVTYTKAPAPELAGKIKAMQGAGRADIDLVLTGTDALAAGIAQNLWTQILPDHSAKLPGLLDNYSASARKMQDLARGQGIVVTFMPAGPLLEFNPDKVKKAPTTAQELLAWCKANPNRLIYARPANSDRKNLPWACLIC